MHDPAPASLTSAGSLTHAHDGEVLMCDDVDLKPQDLELQKDALEPLHHMISLACQDVLPAAGVAICGQVR